TEANRLENRIDQVADAPAIQRVEDWVERLEPSAEIGNGNHAGAAAGEIAHDVQVRAVDAQHELGAGGNGGADFAGVEAVDADAHAVGNEVAYEAAERGERDAGRAADVDHVGARVAEVLSSPAHRIRRHPRHVVDLGDDLDVPGTVVVPRRGAAEVGGNLAQIL